jgi:hypothetical protein
VADAVVPLCSVAQFSEGAYADLAAGYDAGPLNDILIESTRLCEEVAGRRLAPFTVTETLRASGIDPDEYAESASIPMDIQGTLGMSYASALGGMSLVRHFWLHEYPPRYPEMWAYSNVSVTLVRSYGGTQVLQPGQILEGPDDTGHVQVTLGTFLPVGTRIQAAYSGGYQAVPASLVRAGKFMAAYLIVRELNPEDTSHDPDLLREDATTILENWERA